MMILPGILEQISLNQSGFDGEFDLFLRGGSLGSKIAIVSNEDVDGLEIIDINNDGKLDIVTCNSESQTVDWWEQVDINNWNRHQISDGTDLVEIEGVKADDFDGDGKIEVIGLDQGGDKICLFKQDTSDPTGTWSKYDLDLSAPAAQDAHIYDVNGDGKLDFIYTYEGRSLGVGGFYWMEYLGGDPTNNNNWTKHEIAQKEGAFWISKKQVDLSGDGNFNNFVGTCRFKENPDSVRELLWFDPPADPRNPWSSNIIDDSNQTSGYVSQYIDMGSISSTSNGKDLVVSGADGYSKLTLYDESENFNSQIIKNNNYAAIKFFSFTNNEKTEILAGNRDNESIEIIGMFNDNYETVFSQSLPKINDDIPFIDINGDGDKEFIISSAGASGGLFIYSFGRRINNNQNNSIGYYFDGGSRLPIFEISNPPYQGGDVYVSAWIYPEDLSSERMIAALPKGGSNEGFKFRILNNTLDVGFPAGTNATSTFSIPENQWSFVAFSSKADGSSATVQLNDQFQDFSSVGGPTDSFSGALQIGADQSGNEDYFKGYIGDFRLKSQFLNESEMLSIFDLYL